MELSTTSFLIQRAAIDLDDQLFWHVVDIWWRKPHCVNKRVCGADFPIDDLISDNVLENLLPADLSFYQALSQGIPERLELRRLLPKDRRRFGCCWEGLIRDHDAATALFFPSLSSPDHRHKQRNGEAKDIGSGPSDGFLDQAINEGDQSMSKPCHVTFPYAISFRKDHDDKAQLDLVIQRQHGEQPAGEWLSEILMPTLVRWITHCKVKAPLTHSLRLVDLEAYNDCYNRLKAKYGKHLVEIWPERTDPTKFVYEDIAIAAYLLTLWQEDRDVGRCKRMQTFVDLGCGNGLLVYLLASEKHPGCGIDLRRRRIWDSYGPTVSLIERAIEPSDKHLFPDADWIIGNHSDELTPWIPVIASKSSATCNFFVIPCCAWDFKGKYQRKDAELSTYRSYLRYVRLVGEKCGFVSEPDILKIPSTKRACVVGRRNLDAAKEVVERDIRLLVNGQDLDDQTKERWIDSFPQREAKEPVRNCTALPKTSTAAIVKKIVDFLLRENQYVELPNGGQWNLGGSQSLRRCSELLDDEELKLLKAQCGGLQTLIRNHRHVFCVHKGDVSIRNWIAESGQFEKSDKRICWFYKNHPDGCPVGSNCPYLHL